ncbi:MAG: alpha/beta hydrolase [Candidatus Hydrogenedentota bacterium]|nr:MAG: alpha/beta hydrolase [Candidatus Hydrogenedentota bacterium]
MAFCYVRGKRIFFESEGEGSPIVLVHGAGQDTASWRYNIPYLEKSHRVVALDLPGHGKSEVLSPPVNSTSDFADYVWSFMGELCLERPALIGHSMGAGICLTVALKHGKELAGVVAVDGADKVTGVFGEEIHQAYLGASMELMLEMSAESFRALCSKSTPRDRVEEIAQDLLRIHPRVTAADTQAFNSFDISDRSHDIGAPVLFISGSDDFLVTPQMVHETAERIKGSREVILDGVGHFPHTEAPDRFNREAGEFLASS